MKLASNEIMIDNLSESTFELLIDQQISKAYMYQSILNLTKLETANKLDITLRKLNELHNVLKVRMETHVQPGLTVDFVKELINLEQACVSYWNMGLIDKYRTHRNSVNERSNMRHRKMILHGLPFLEQNLKPKRKRK